MSTPADPQEMVQAIAKQTIEVQQGRGIVPETFDDLWRMAKSAATSGFAPRGMTRPEQCFVAMQTGMEAGLTPMQSLRSMAVINGVPSWKGEAALALVYASGKLDTMRDEITGEGDSLKCSVYMRRIEGQEIRRDFSLADAKRAGLLNRKDSPWVAYPKRMVFWRAMGFALKDLFGDVLMGLAVAEEVQEWTPRRRERTELEAPAVDDPLLRGETVSAAVQPEPAADSITEPEANKPSTDGVGSTPEEEVEVDPNTGEVVPPEAGRMF